MKVTRASVAEKIEGKGYVPIQIDGIPEGFSFWAQQDRVMANVRDLGTFVAFRPLKEMDSFDAACYVPVITEVDASEELIEEVMNDAKHKLLEVFMKN